MRPSPDIRLRGATLRLHARGDPIATVDGAALERILVNLLDNAVRYGPDGQTINVTLDADDRVACLTVDDEGPGIPLRDRARVWAPYVRLHDPARTAVTGCGIGLAIVRELVTLHGGRIEIVDGARGGACFRVELPLHGAGVPAHGKERATGP